MARGYITAGGLILPKTAGAGIKTDADGSPDYNWRDLHGPIIPHPSGGTAPTSKLIRGTGTHIRGYAFSAGDEIDDITFHLDHDYPPATNAYLHTHWEHAGTAISGSLVINWYLTLCKGYNQSAQVFVAEKNITQTISVTNVAGHPQYAHHIDEFAITNNGGDATHFDRALLEPDMIIKCAAVVTTIPTITGSPAGSADEPFILHADLHLQSTSVGTKNKNYPFYT